MNRSELAQVFDRLKAIYPPPRGAELTSEAFVREWLRAVGWAPFTDVSAAVDWYLGSSEDYWPKPGKIASWIREHRKALPTTNATESAYLAWEATWGRRDVVLNGIEQATYTGCPVCGAEPSWEGGRLRVTHRAALHRARGLPVIGWSDEVATYYGAA